MLKFASICPHPPIIIPNIGGAELSKVKKTVQAMKKLADDFAAIQPETTIIISPHGPIQLNKMTINNAERMVSDFWQFGDYQTAKMVFENDLEIINKIKQEAEKNKIPLDLIKIPQLDHGAGVPLYYLSKQWQSKIVPIAFSFLDLQTHFEFGKVIGRASQDNLKQKIALVASGDLSHRITAEAPAGYSPVGKEFDEKLIKLLKNNDIQGILNLEPEFIEEAGECGLRSIIILLGALSIIKPLPKFQLLSYEAPFGVGYLVARFI